jgi:cytochrome c biogenesis protein CcdA
MVLAIVFAFVAGLITAVSPCVLPVLPIVLAGGVGENRRRPFAIIAGLALSFLVSILFATWILDRLGLPKDLLRNI